MCRHNVYEHVIDKRIIGRGIYSYKEFNAKIIILFSSQLNHIQMASVFDFNSSFFFSAVSDDSTSSDYSQTVNDTYNPNTTATCCQPLPLDLGLFDKLHRQKHQRQQKLK